MTPIRELLIGGDMADDIHGIMQNTHNEYAVCFNGVKDDVTGALIAEQPRLNLIYGTA